jgi:uncharacterized protein YhbP (UPF0306 family)
MVEDLIKQYVNKSNIMQLATCVNDQPWVVTLHFFADEQLNFYWTSRPERRHSKEIFLNSNVSNTILLHENTDDEDWVIGLSANGKAELLDEVEDSVSSAYVAKLLKNPDLPAKITNGSDPAKWYRFIPSSIVLFDNKDFPNDPRQELEIKH